MNKELLDIVIARMNENMSANDQQIREHEEEIQVLGYIVEMAKQLKEKAVLDEAVEGRRVELTEIEDRVANRYKEEKDQIEEIDENIGNHNARLKDVKAETDSEIDACMLKCKDIITGYEKHATEENRKQDNETKEFITRKNKAEEQCSIVEAALASLKAKAANA